VTARKDDAPAAVQAAIVKIAGSSSISGGGGLIHTTSGRRQQRVDRDHRRGFRWRAQGRLKVISSRARCHASQCEHSSDVVAQFLVARVNRAVAAVAQQAWPPADCVYMTTVHRNANSGAPLRFA
jgi:hypothetical protein